MKLKQHWAKKNWTKNDSKIGVNLNVLIWNLLAPIGTASHSTHTKLKYLDSNSMWCCVQIVKEQKVLQKMTTLPTICWNSNQIFLKRCCDDHLKNFGMYMRSPSGLKDWTFLHLLQALSTKLNFFEYITSFYLYIYSIHNICITYQ